MHHFQALTDLQKSILGHQVKRSLTYTWLCPKPQSLAIRNKAENIVIYSPAYQFSGLRDVHII